MPDELSHLKVLLDCSTPFGVMETVEEVRAGRLAGSRLGA